VARTTSRTVDCFFDGACKGNQFAQKGPMWVAYVIGREEHVHEIPDLPSAQGPLRSNNIAEYEALIRLLRRVRELDSWRSGSRYVVSGDSQLVVYQMQGRYRVREPHLIDLHEQARVLAAELPVSFRWVPREENRAGHLLEAV
jgi:ribonuclease HI